MKHFAYHTRSYADNFTQQLPLDLRQTYTSLLPPHTLEALLYGYDQIDRWQRNDPRYDGLELPSETNRQHVEEMLVLVNFVERELPELASLLDLDTVRLMVLLHDLGE